MISGVLLFVVTVAAVIVDKPFPTNTVLYRANGGAAQTYLYPQTVDAVNNPNGLPSFLVFDDWVNPGSFVSGPVTGFAGDFVKNTTAGIFGRQFWGFSHSFVDKDGLGVTTYPTDFGGCQVIRCVDKKCSTFTRGRINLKDTVNFCDVRQRNDGVFVWAGADPSSGLQFGVCNDKTCATQSIIRTLAIGSSKSTGPSPAIGIHSSGDVTMMVVTDSTAAAGAQVYYVRCFDTNCTTAITRGPLLKLDSNFNSFKTTVFMKYKTLSNGESVTFLPGGKRVRCYDIDCAEYSVDTFGFPTGISAFASVSDNNAVDESSPGRMFMAVTTSSAGSYVWRCFDVLCYFYSNVIHHSSPNSGMRGNKMPPQLADTANGSAIIIDSNQRSWFDSQGFTNYDNTAAIIGYPDFDWGVPPSSLTPPTLARNVSAILSCIGNAVQCPPATTTSTTTSTTSTSAATTTTTKMTTTTSSTTQSQTTTTSSTPAPQTIVFTGSRWEVSWPSKVIATYPYSWNAMLPGSATLNSGQPTVFLTNNGSPYNTSIGIVQSGATVQLRSLASQTRTWRGIQTQRTANGYASFLQQGDFQCVYHECVDTACSSYTAKSVNGNDQCAMGTVQGKPHYVVSSQNSITLYRCDTAGCLTSTMLKSISVPQTPTTVRVMMTVVSDRIVIHAGVQSAYSANCLDLWLISCDDAACSCYQIREIARCAKSSSIAELAQSMFAYGNDKHVAFTSINNTASRVLCNDIQCNTVTIDAIARVSSVYANNYRVAERAPGQMFISTSSHSYWKCWDPLCYYNSTEVKLVRTSPYLRDATDAPGYLADATSGVSYILDTEGNRDSFNPPTSSNIVLVELNLNWGSAPSNLNPPTTTSTSTVFVRSCSGTAQPSQSTLSTTTTTTKATTTTVASSTLSTTLSTSTTTASGATTTTAAGPTTTSTNGAPTNTDASTATTLTSTSLPTTATTGESTQSTLTSTMTSTNGGGGSTTSDTSVISTTSTDTLTTISIASTTRVCSIALLVLSASLVL